MRNRVGIEPNIAYNPIEIILKVLNCKDLKNASLNLLKMLELLKKRGLIYF